MDRKDIEKLKKLAVMVAEAHESTDGLCGLRPYSDFKNGKLDSPHIHLSKKTFLETFKDFETEEREYGDTEMFVIEDGVRIFAIEEIGSEVE